MELTCRSLSRVGSEGIPHGAVLHQLPMEVDDTAATRTLVQVVDVLRDDRHTIVVLEAGEQTMPFVGLCSDELPTALIVEVQHALGIAVPAFDAGDLLDVMPRPQTIAIAEGRQAALGTHPRPREDDEVRALGALGIHRRETSDSSWMRRGHSPNWSMSRRT